MRVYQRLPLYEKGGFLNRRIVERFAEYAGIVAERFGDRVELFAVFNEPLVVLVNCTHLKAPKTMADVEAARMATFGVGDTILDNTGTFWEPLIFGKYDQRIVEKLGIDLSFVQDGEMEYICCNPDFMGCNV